MRKLDYQRFIDRLPFDMSIEALAAILLADQGANWEMDQFVVRPKGKKGFLKDIRQVEESNYGGKDILYFDVSRDGLFDALPALLFLDEERAKGRQEERPVTYTEQVSEARKFFLPFDQAIFLSRIAVAVWEHWTVQSPAAILERFWKLPPVWRQLSNEQKTAIIFLLPIVEQIAGDIEKTVLCFQIILGTKDLQIQRTTPIRAGIPEGARPPVGEATLGEDLIVGREYDDGIPDWEIQVSSISAWQIEEFLVDQEVKGRSLRLLEDILLPYFIPVEVDVRLTFHTSRDSKDFTLSSDSYTSILGYTTNL